MVCDTCEKKLGKLVVPDKVGGVRRVFVLCVCVVAGVGGTLSRSVGRVSTIYVCAYARVRGCVLCYVVAVAWGLSPGGQCGGGGRVNLCVRFG